MKKFPKSTPLESLGKVSFRQRFLARSHPHITVNFVGHPPNDVPIELLPKLVPGSCYENKARVSPQGVKEQKLIVESARPFLDPVSGRRYVEIMSQINQRAIIPQIELARALFLHNSHLARTAFRPDGLSGLAQISNADDRTVIIMNEMSDYPVSNLKASKACFHLAWLLLDDQARKSFGTILDATQKPDNPNGNFEFIPPSLARWTITGKGSADHQEGEAIELTEITGFHNPNFVLEKPVEIVHPRFRDSIPVDKKPRDKPAQSERPDPDPEVDLSMRPSKKRGTDRVNDHGLTFTFAETEPVLVKANGTEGKVTPDNKQGKDRAEPKTEYSSAGHGDETGPARELDVGINRSDSEDVKLPELEGIEPNERFPLFEQVINELTTGDRFTLREIKCFKLPEPITDSRVIHKTKNGKPLQCYVAVISHQDEDLAIIEIDVENLRPSKAISTLIVGFRVDQDPNHCIVEILRSCATARVRWNMEDIKYYVGHAHKCYHPRREKKAGEMTRKLTPEEYQDRWYELLRSKLNSIV